MHPTRPRQSKANQDGILDRFIPPRSLRSSESRWSAGGVGADGTESDPTAQSILERDLRSDRRSSYRHLLRDALFGEQRCARVLPLGLGVADGVGDAAPEHTKEAERKDWAVRARRDPLIGAPEMAVCLPELPKVRASRVRMDQLMAWGACGVLAVAGHHEVFLWRRPVESNMPGTAGASELLVHFSSETRPTSLCWSPSPDRPLLVIGAVGGAGQEESESRVQMWNCNSKKKLFSRRMPVGVINAISWHPYEDIIAMGSCIGAVFVVTTSLSIVKSVRVFQHGNGVATLSFSPDGVHLACGGMAGAALVWNWDTGVVVGDEVDYGSTITSLCWHPWRTSLVAVGTLLGDIALLNFSTRRTTTASYRGTNYQAVSVTAMSFSQRTAELVVAFAGRGDKSQVAVLSNLTTVVDRLQVHKAMVNYICWSPDGALMATAGADEMLCMWNFLGAKTTKELRRRALQESREDRSGVRRQFGCIIR